MWLVDIIEISERSSTSVSSDDIAGCELCTMTGRAGGFSSGNLTGIRCGGRSRVISLPCLDLDLRRTMRCGLSTSQTLSLLLEGGRDGAREAGREEACEAGREADREGGRPRGRPGREVDREGGREAAREDGREENPGCR